MIRRRIYTKYFFPLYVPIVLISIVIVAIFYPQIASGVFFVLPLFLLLLLLTFFIPGGNQPLSSKEKNIPNRFVWLLAWLGLQISLAIILWGAMFITHEALNVQSTQANLFTDFFIHTGFYPWSLCLSLSIIAARFAQSDKYALQFRIPLKFFFKSTVDGVMGAGADLSLKHGLYIASALTCGIYLGKLIDPILSANSELNVTILLFFTIVYLLLASRFGQQLLAYFCKKNIPEFMFFNVLGAIIFLVAILYYWGQKLIGTYFSEPVYHAKLTLFAIENPEALWKLFYVVLSTLWALQLTRIVRYLAQGYSLVAVLTTALFLPICVAIMMLIDEYGLHQHLIITLSAIHLNNNLTLVFLIIGFVLSSLFFKDPRTLRLIHVANLTKRNKMSFVTAKTVSMLMTSIFLLYLLGGLSWIIIVIAGISVPIFTMLILISLGAFNRRGSHRLANNVPSQKPE